VNMRARHGQAIRAIVVVVSVLAFAGPVAAFDSFAELRAIRPPQLTIRPDGAVVRESFEILIAQTNTRVRLDGVPRDADPASIMVIDKMGDLKLLEWRTFESRPTGTQNVAPEGKGIRIDLEGAWSARPDTPLSMEATLESRITGARKFDLVYAVTGMTWRSSYEVLIRGEISDINSALSMDVDGWIHIDIPTGRAYSNASVTVIGPDLQGYLPPTGHKPPGILDLDDDSPLADLWRETPADPYTSHVYPLSRPVTIPAQQSIMVSRVAVARKPVQRLLVVKAEDIPTDTYIQYGKPSQIITFQNESDYGGDSAVPPGPALIHIGSQRLTVYQRAWFKHTPASGEIRIDMGPVAGIKARRINRGFVKMAGGGYEQTFELRVQNDLSQTARVLIDEEPPVFNLAWTLLRANHPFEEVDQRLRFNMEINPNAESIIQYTVRYSLPER